MKPLIPFLSFLLVTLSPCLAQGTRWSAEKAGDWYARQPWLVGANFSPVYAVNQLEMWQKDTYDPAQIDKELGWARQLGFNTMRVFLHNIVFETEGDAFLDRIDQFLGICKKHHIRPMLVLFDDVWNPDPKPGPQPAPRPGVHNSGWVQGPGRAVVGDKSRWNELKPYVSAVVGRFKDDPRVLAWDLYNEPGNLNNAQYRPLEPRNKEELSLGLLTLFFEWAREAGATQPLTAGVWSGDWKNPDKLSPLNAFQIENSDILSFHAYWEPEETKKVTEALVKYGRPVLCTEYMARPRGSTFEGILPWFREHKIAAYNWGFVAGKTNTIHAWDTWEKPDTAEPKIWFHDILRPNGAPYSEEEAALIKKLTGASQ